MTVVSRYYSADALQQCENVTIPAKCLTATDIDTGVVAGRYDVPDVYTVYFTYYKKNTPGRYSRLFGQN